MQPMEMAAMDDVLSRNERLLNITTSHNQSILDRRRRSTARDRALREECATHPRGPHNWKTAMSVGVMISPEVGTHPTSAVPLQCVSSVDTCRCACDLV